MHPSFYSKEDIIFGKSYKEWITCWCQWFYSKNEDTTELECESIDNIYFLGTKLTLPHREVVFQAYDKIPKDKAILINTGKWTAIGSPYVKQTYSLAGLARKRIDSLEDYKVLINNERVVPERVASDVFNLKVNRNIGGYEDPILGHMLDIKKGKYIAVIDGYWLFLKPSNDIGNYEINSFTSCKSRILSLNIKHYVTIF